MPGDKAISFFSVSHSSSSKELSSSWHTMEHGRDSETQVREQEKTLIREDNEQWLGQGISYSWWWVDIINRLRDQEKGNNEREREKHTKEEAVEWEDKRGRYDS